MSNMDIEAAELVVVLPVVSSAVAAAGMAIRFFWRQSKCAALQAQRVERLEKRFDEFEDLLHKAIEQVQEDHAAEVERGRQTHGKQFAMIGEVQVTVARIETAVKALADKR